MSSRVNSGIFYAFRSSASTSLASLGKWPNVEKSSSPPEWNLSEEPATSAFKDELDFLKTWQGCDLTSLQSKIVGVWWHIVLWSLMVVTTKWLNNLDCVQKLLKLFAAWKGEKFLMSYNFSHHHNKQMRIQGETEIFDFWHVWYVPQWSLNHRPPSNIRPWRFVTLSLTHETVSSKNIWKPAAGQEWAECVGMNESVLLFKESGDKILPEGDVSPPVGQTQLWLSLLLPHSGLSTEQWRHQWTDEEKVWKTSWSFETAGETPGSPVPGKCPQT